MKKHNIILFMLIMVFSFFTLNSCKKDKDPVVNDTPTYSFVKPTKLEYNVGDELDITGSYILLDYKEKEDEKVVLTINMLNESTIPSFNESGSFNISGKYNEFSFSFTIVINEVIAPSTYTISFVTSFGDAPTSITNVTKLPDALPELEYEGYIFKGWYLDDKFTTAITPSSEITSDVILYAKWEKDEVVLTNIEVSLISEDYQYIRTTDPSSNLQVREVYSNNTYSEWMKITNKNITGYEIIDNLVTFEISVMIRSVSYKNSITLPLNETVISIDEFFNKTVGERSTITGVVIAFTSTISTNDMIIMDKTTNSIIAVSNFGDGKLHNGYYDSYSVNIGDEVIIPVVYTQADIDANNGNSGRICATYDGGSYGDMAVISSDNDISVNKDPLQVSSQEELVNLLNSSNRTQNIYKLIKFKGEMNFIHYVSSDLFRFWFEDGNISTYNEQMIEGVSPVFSSGQTWFTFGKNFQELAFGDERVTSVDWDNPTNRVLEIDALFIGGNGYYYQFVILNENAVKEVEVNIENVRVVEPAKTKYSLNTSLDLTGAQVVFEYDIRSDVIYDLTLDMLDSTTIPDFTTSGIYTIKGNYLGYDFSFDIEIIEAVISSIEIVKQPNILVYSHRATYKDLDLNGGQIQINYSNNTTQIIDMTQEMLPSNESENWQIGEVTYMISYLGHSTPLTVTFENQAISISEFLKGTIGEIYEVTGIVVGPASTHSTTDLLIKDKESMDILTINNTGIAGKYNAIQLDTEYLNPGDEIVVSLKLRQNSTENSGSYNKICANSSSGTKDSFVKSIIKLSTNNPIVWDFENTNVYVIETQDDLVSFLNNEDRFHSYVKFVGMKGYWQNSGYRIFFGNNITSTNSQKVNGVSPFLYSINTDYYLTNSIKTYFSNSTSQNYSNPAKTSYNIYSLFLGGSTYYHDFTVLDDSWIVSENN